ncbi:hypothetical protein DH2020_032140 [Rehmannia glutinosa]|uniref:Uncharacterized protein n=1 Tax=Rehmannia glutinosa TaxID=99300 RepID=A0ABR0VID1_REHGL
MNPNMELFSNLALMENFNTTVNHGIMHDGFSDHQHQSHQLPTAFDNEIQRSIPIFDPMVNFFPLGHGCNNIMNMVHEPEIQVNLSPSVSGTGFVGPNNKVNKKHLGEKRKRNSDREIEKPREVVHVRAKRGQATDSHSLAERFLSMKLSAASLFYDFNSSEAEAMESVQGTSGYEAAQMMEKLVGEGYGGISQFQTGPNWPL